ncbi:MAG: hypothetical protein HOP12_05060 [Candidatus Eisenbacteria bacterium]|uniref:Uncharacterized protein n=1 Tax=Eiseniibacteriota bacterium TaxID=2212470 RepID=A0A849SNN4_UNCEI|nr:hypothetical protein [Candidatus Eisenbacteria bacterium]
MPDFVSKIRVPVRVSRANEPPLDAVICLAPSAPVHSGPETILERLNAPDRVVPLEPVQGDAIMLVSRHDLEWVAPRPGVDLKLIGPATFRVTHQERVHVRMCSGERLEGVIQMELPDGYNRVSDFLNESDDFFPFATADGVMLVNKFAVREVALFEPSPLPERR